MMTKMITKIIMTMVMRMIVKMMMDVDQTGLARWRKQKIINSAIKLRSRQIIRKDGPYNFVSTRKEMIPS